MSPLERARAFHRCMEREAANARSIAVACHEGNYPHETCRLRGRAAMILTDAADHALRVVLTLEETTRDTVTNNRRRD